jgi:signal peptidase I
LDQYNIEMSTSVNFENTIRDKEIKKRIKPTLLQELIEYLFYFLEIFVFVSLIYFFIKTSLYNKITIAGLSMYPTFNDYEENPNKRDLIYIDLLTPKFSEYRRGDVVVLLSAPKPDGKRELYIKRVIGLPGETIIFDKGEVIIKNEKYPEGVTLIESYLPPDVKTYKELTFDKGRYEERSLEEDEFYVIGDNRPGSSDSRVFGPVPREYIIGRQFYRLTPEEKAGWFTLPEYNISN